MAFLILDELQMEVVEENEADNVEFDDIEVERVQRKFGERVDPFAKYNDKEFKQRYRLPKDVVQLLANRMVELEITGPLAGQGFALTPELTVCVGLRFLATGSMYREIADSHGVSRAAVCRSVAKTVQLLVEVHAEFIKFPHTREERERSHVLFSRIADFPNVIGAVDGTHVPIKCPVEHRPYKNRKGFYSMNVQVMVDARGFFIDVDATWAGASADVTIWERSTIGRSCLEDAYLEGSFLLGDSGYPLRRWMMTPYGEPDTQPQQRYNYAHSRTRQLVENTIGLWKMRFRCLHNTGGVIQSNPVTCSKMILATAVLHNLAKGANMDMMDVDEPADPREFYEPPPRPDEVYVAGRHDRLLYRHGQEMRDDITLRFFT